jgi:hypothetical protein
MSLLRPLALAALLAVPTFSWATGPSWITVRLRPVAANAGGEVLMKTWREANPEGAHRATPVGLGWLVVSAGGLWKEATHRVDVSQDEARSWFEGPLVWRALPASLRPLLAGHRFTEADAVKPDEGAEAVVWTAERACIRDRCTPSEPTQRTVGGLPAERDPVGQPECRFYRAGVAVLRNSRGGDEVQQGARFDHPGSAIHDDPALGPQELGFDIWVVDGVALVPERALRAKK